MNLGVILARRDLREEKEGENDVNVFQFQKQKLGTIRNITINGIR